MRFKSQPRLRSLARLVTQNYRLRVLFQGNQACISGNTMFIPPVENTAEAFSRAKYSVAHECGHSLYSDFGVMEQARKEDRRLPKVLNCLEDARTERLMIRRFEGLESEMARNIKGIMQSWDVGTMPLSQQILFGLFLVGRGFEVPFGDGAKRILSELEPLILEASDAKDSEAVLGIARQVLKRLDRIIDEEPQAKPLKGAGFGDSDMSDAIVDRVEEVVIHDDMDDFPHMKDENAPESETIMDVPEASLPDYLSELAPLRSEMNYLIQHMRKIVEQKRSAKRRAGIRTAKSGAVDTKRVWKVATGSEDIMKQRCFSESRDVDPDSLAVYLLVDESHSMMEQERYVYARQASIILGEALGELGIRFAMTGYTTASNLARYIYKEFDDSWADVRTRLLSMRHRNGTFTSEHLPFALRCLAKRSERKKLLVVVTGATEIESPYRLKEAILDARDEGVEIVGIGIQTSLMSEWFDRYIEITQLGGFARAMMNLLRDVIRR